jgi:aminopeptidase N
MLGIVLSRSHRLIVAFLAVSFLLAGAGRSEAQRLPTTVVPENYKLLIDAEISAGRFSGEEQIAVRVSQPLNEVVLNSLDLEITGAEITAAGSSQTAQVEYDKSAEMVRLKPAHPVPAGPATLQLKFSGPLKDGLRGLYLSKTPRRAYAVTQFEGTYARMMFPSFDEPGFKATFDLSVVLDKGDTAISNGAIISDEKLGDRHKITFSTSPRMSTYLVALAIGDWQCVKKKVDGTPIRVCAVPEKKDKAKFALDVATHALRFYNQWYGIKYPFGKLDMVAIPDYEWGGMENTASIFYRDSSLLLDENTASVQGKRGHATVIAHEIAHQWFGDLVTPAWWDDIWLNEGFATWMERKPIEAWHPEWNLDQDAAAAAQRIISVDSLSSARAIHGEPNTPSEIKEMFDGITYEKGGAVLRMLEAYVGPEVFRRGVNQYLQEHANGSATSQDFWRVLSRVSGKPVDKLMPTFVLQPGVPVVSIRGSCQNGHTPLQISQERFLFSRGSGSTEQWQIPVCLKTAGKSDSQCFLLTDKMQHFDLNACPARLFGNRQADGYYRVAYEPEMLARIAGSAEKELSAVERVALVEDAWAMTRAGRYPVGQFLQVAQAMRAEHERSVIDLLTAHLEAAGASLVAQDQREKYNQFLREQFTPLASELGWKERSSDTDEQRALRARLLGVLGAARDPGAVAAAQNAVKDYLKNAGSVEGTFASAAFSVAAQNGDAALYDTIHSAFLKPGAAGQYYQYLFALAAFPQPALAQRTLALIDQGKVHQQDYPSFFSALLANPASRPAAWAYLKDHWDSLAVKVTSFGGRGAVSALGDFCSVKERDDVQQFFASRRPPGAERALKQSLERMNDCLEFKQAQETNMTKWLAESATTGN